MQPTQLNNSGGLPENVSYPTGDKKFRNLSIIHFNLIFF